MPYFWVQLQCSIIASSNSAFHKYCINILKLDALYHCCSNLITSFVVFPYRLMISLLAVQLWSLIPLRQFGYFFWFLSLQFYFYTSYHFGCNLAISDACVILLLLEQYMYWIWKVWWTKGDRDKLCNCATSLRCLLPSAADRCWLGSSTYSLVTRTPQSHHHIVQIL